MSTNPSKYYSNQYFMSLALQQARMSLGTTKENPAVGCVVVRNNHLISAGHTSINGRPHAEQNAIDLIKKNTKNSDLYVTLEPCSHYGRTPPCVKSIIKSKFNKVFFSVHDPDKRSYKKCSPLLRKHRITVNKNLMGNVVKDFYRSYFKSKNKGLPFVTSKLAISKDFYTINKKNRWITNELSRGRVHLMRATHDCIMTSSNTIIKDNPKLTCRIKGLNHRSPARIILDKKLRIRINSNVIKEANKFPTIIFYNKSNLKKIKLLKKLKVKSHKISLESDGQLSLRKSLVKAKELGYSRILIEAGKILTDSLLDKNLVDDFKLFISNESLWNKGKGNIRKYFKSYLRNKKKVVEKVNLSGDKLISYKIK